MRLLDVDGKVLFAGTGIRAITFYHALEEKLEPMMGVSPFTREHFHLEVIDSSVERFQTSYRLVNTELSDRRDVRVMRPELERAAYWREG